MVLPRWLFFLVAFWVIAFGAFRLYLAATRNRSVPSDRPSFRTRGLFARSARAHTVYGALYLVLGAYLLATGFGYGFTYQGGCQRPDAPASLPTG